MDKWRFELARLKRQGMLRSLRVVDGGQGPVVQVNGQDVLLLCSNNYLGIANHPALVEKMVAATQRYGAGSGASRLISGTMPPHAELEERIAMFKETEAALLFNSGYAANTGVLQGLFGPDDLIFSDALNHASIIDGIRLCKAQRYIYKHADMADLEEKLKETQNLRYRLVATDGVFSMDGDIAKLDEICALAEKYDAMVMIDDAHSTGFIGKTGRGTPEYRGVMDKVDIITGTLGKALGGASGGFISGKKELIELYRQRSRPYLFSNTLAPVVVGASIAVFDLLSETTELRDKLEENTTYFREKMTEAGFDITPGVHPIVPIMLGKFENDAKLSQDMARDLLAEGIYVIGFYYPVVPKGQSRIRVQLSAAHDRPHLDRAIEAFTKIGKKYNVIS